MSGPKALEWEVDDQELQLERARAVARENYARAYQRWHEMRQQARAEHVRLPGGAHLSTAPPADLADADTETLVEACAAAAAAARAGRTALDEAAQVRRLTTHAEELLLRRAELTAQLDRHQSAPRIPETLAELRQLVTGLQDETRALAGEWATVQLGQELAAQLTEARDEAPSLADIAVPLRGRATAARTAAVQDEADRILTGLPGGTAPWAHLAEAQAAALAQPFGATVHLHAMQRMVQAAQAADRLRDAAWEQLDLLAARASCTGDRVVMEGLDDAREQLGAALSPPFSDEGTTRRTVAGVLDGAAAAVERAEAASIAAAQQDFVLQQVALALGELGYDVVLGVETFVPAAGVLARVPGHLDHAVWAEVSGDALGLQVVRTAPGADQRAGVQAEHQLCESLQPLQRTLTARGVSTQVVRAFAPGDVPLRHVDVPQRATAAMTAARQPALARPLPTSPPER